MNVRRTGKGTRRSEHILGLGVTLAAGVAYLLTLSPTVNFLDSGELITVGATAGIAHPPGYPLYTLLLIVAGAIPLGDVAVRINLVSALAATGAVGLFYVLVYELLAHHLFTPTEPAPLARTSRRVAPPPGQRRTARAAEEPIEAPPPPPVNPRPTPARVRAAVAAAAAAGLLATSLTFWNWATQAKMYPLHFAFVAGLLWGALRVRRAWRTDPGGGRRWPPGAWSGGVRALVALAFFTGLSFANHGMTLWLLPGLAILLLWPEQRGADPLARPSGPAVPPWRRLLGALPLLIGAGLLPFLLYLYLPLRAAQSPLMNWGSPNTWGDFWRHVTAWQFRVYVGQVSSFNYLGDAGRYALQQWGLGLGVIIGLLALAGVLRLTRRNQAILFATLVIALLTLVFTLNYQIREVIVYYVPMYMMILVWTGVGLGWLLQTAAAWLDQQVTRDPPAPVATADPAAPAALAPVAAPTRSLQTTWVAAVFPLLLVLVAAGWNLGRAGHRADYLAEAYVRNHFKNFAPNAVVITDNWDLVSPTYYLQEVRGERRDVAVLDKNLMRYPFYLDYLDRAYPQVMEPVKDLEAQYRALNREWLNSNGSVNPPGLQQAYIDLLRGITTKSLDAGRPLYYQWIARSANQIDADARALAENLYITAEGLAFRVTRTAITTAPADPQLDWRGILENPVPKDEVAHSVIDFYPVALERLANVANANDYTAEARLFTAQAIAVRAALGLPLQPDTMETP